MRHNLRISTINPISHNKPDKFTNSETTKTMKEDEDLTKKYIVSDEHKDIFQPDATDKTNIIDSIIKALGEPGGDNTYELSYHGGRWWIDHMVVGSGEPLRQFLDDAISDAVSDVVKNNYKP